MTDTGQTRDRRWPRRVYGVGSEPDPRFSLANERTFLAWIRTALGFLVAGVGVATVAQFTTTFRVEIRVMALALVLGGLLCATGGFWRWMRQERAIRLEQPLPSTSVMAFIAGIAGLVALAALVLIVFR